MKAGISPCEFIAARYPIEYPASEPANVPIILAVRNLKENSGNTITARRKSVCAGVGRTDASAKFKMKRKTIIHFVLF